MVIFKVASYIEVRLYFAPVSFAPSHPTRKPDDALVNAINCKSSPFWKVMTLPFKLLGAKGFKTIKERVHLNIRRPRRYRPCSGTLAAGCLL